MVEFLAALSGALVGAAMVFVAESWRQVLAGNAAARLIYVEAHSNALLCDWAARGQSYRPLSDTAWRTYSVHIVPLLTADASQDIAGTYLALPATQQLIEGLQNRPQDLKAEGTLASLESHSLDFRKAAYWMHVIENKRRFRVLAELLIDRPRLPSGTDIVRAVAAADSETARGRS
jgi:hypothetical protein